MIEFKKYMNSFNSKNVCFQFIIINIAIFIIISLSLFVIWLFQIQTESSAGLAEYFMIYSQPHHFLKQPWSIFTYMFLHADVMHLFFNMLCLYGFGQLFLLFYNPTHFKGVYLWGGFLGGVGYLILYNIIPAFQGHLYDIPMVGASASILALITSMAYHSPEYKVNLFLLGRYSLKYIAIGFVVLDLLFLPRGNAGGHIAHLGGALAGVLFAYALKRGVDLTRWLTIPLKSFASLLKHIHEPQKRKPKMKVHYAEREKDYTYNQRKKEKTDEIDRILEKLKKSGYESLTSEEKQSLFNASKKNK